RRTPQKAPERRRIRHPCPAEQPPDTPRAQEAQVVQPPAPVEEQRHPRLHPQARPIHPRHTAHLLLEATAQTELVPDSAQKNEPGSVREVACAVTQRERSGIALHMRPGRNMMRAHRLGASECEGYFLVEAPVF